MALPYSNLHPVTEANPYPVYLAAPIRDWITVAASFSRTRPQQLPAKRGKREREAVVPTGPERTYMTGDVVSDGRPTATLTFTDMVAVPGGNSRIVGAMLQTNKAGVTARYRVHLYNAVDVTLAADSDPHSELWADRAKRIATFDLPPMIAPAGVGTDCSRSYDMNLSVPVTAAPESRHIYASLEALDDHDADPAQTYELSLTSETH